MDHIKLAQLAKKAAKGDNAAFAELYEETFDRFYYVALKTVRQPEDAADIVQEAMLDIYKNLKKLNNDRAFVAYANRVVYGKSIDFLRSQNKWTLAGDFELPEQMETNDDFLPESYVATREKRQIVIGAIDSLSNSLRVIILMYYYDQLTTPEIASILNIQENAVRTRLSRARVILKKKLEEDERKEHYLFMPILALTQILEENAAVCVSAEMKAKVWQGVSQSIGFSETADPGKSNSSSSSALKAGVLTVVVIAAVVIGLWLFSDMRKPPTDENPVVPTPPDTVSPVPNENETPHYPDETTNPPGTTDNGSGLNDNNSNDFLNNSSGTETESGDNTNENLPPPSPQPTPSQVTQIPSIAIESTKLVYPAGMTITAEQILADSGARAKYSDNQLEIIALEEVDSATPGEYYIYIRLLDDEIEGLRQVVVTIVVTKGEV